MCIIKPLIEIRCLIKLHDCRPGGDVGQLPKRLKLEIGIDEKQWENLCDQLIQTLVYS